MVSSPAIRYHTNKQLLRVHIRIPTVRRALRKLDTSKTTGLDGIPATLIKSCADELALPPSKLFSLFIAETLDSGQHFESISLPGLQ